jgi:hypothetical protein
LNVCLNARLNACIARLGVERIAMAVGQSASRRATRLAPRMRNRDAVM